MSAAELAAARAERAARYAAQQASAATLPPPAPAASQQEVEGGAAEAPPRRRRLGGEHAADADVLDGIELSGERDRQGTHAATEVDCRLWESAWAPVARDSRVHVLQRGEGRLADTPAGDEAARERNIRFLTESARRIQQARGRGERVWVHCTEGSNRGPAGLLAYLLLHTRVPSLHAACRVVKRARPRARTRSNTFALELETICGRAGKPVQ